MISPPHLVALLLAAHLVASAATNHSVDDLDPLFKYSVGWEINTQNLNISTGANMDKDGSHHLASSPGLSATITYTCAYFSKVNSMIIVPNRFPCHLSLFSLYFTIASEIVGLNEHLFTVASVYFLACLWPYPVSTNYAIDGNPPMTIDMEDHAPTINTGGNASVASNVLGWWISNANQEHTIHITVPAGAQYSVVDMFM